MTFILKDKLIYVVGNHGLANNTIEGTVETPEIGKDYELEYTVNNTGYRPLKDKIVLTEEDLKHTEVFIVVRAKLGKHILYYKSDVIPLTHAIIFGRKLEDQYPEALKFLLKEQENLRLEMKKLRHQIGLEVHKTDQHLKGTMKEVVETFEEINRKGSLF
jgi:hypothetical protein